MGKNNGMNRLRDDKFVKASRKNDMSDMENVDVRVECEFE